MSKNTSNKSCSELNFLQKTQETHMSIVLESRARGLQRLLFLKYYDVLKYENRFVLGLNAVKNSDYVTKCFKQKLFRVKFPTKKRWRRISLSSAGVELGMTHFPICGVVKN